MNIAKSCSKSGPCPTYCMHAHFRIHVASVPSIRIKTGNPSFTNLFGFRISFGLVKKVNENGGGSCTTTSRTPPSLHRRSMSRNILGEETSSPMFSVNSARPVVQLSPWAVLPFHTPVSARLWMRWRLTVDFGCQLIVWQLRTVLLCLYIQQWNRGFCSEKKLKNPIIWVNRMFASMMFIFSMWPPSIDYSQTPLYILPAIRNFDLRNFFFQCNIRNEYLNFVMRTSLNILYLILRTLLNVLWQCRNKAKKCIVTSSCEYWTINLCPLWPRDGSAKTFSHRIRICTFSQSSSHRTAFASHFGFASHFLHIFHTFALFSPFWSLFYSLCTKKLWKKISAKKCAKYAKKKCENAKNAKKCKKLRSANAMQKWNQNSHCIALLCGKVFAFFRIAFASRIPAVAFFHNFHTWPNFHEDFRIFWGRSLTN